MTMKKQINLTLWFNTVRRALRDEPHGPRREFLAQMLLELNRRLPEREA